MLKQGWEESDVLILKDGMVDLRLEVRDPGSTLTRRLVHASDPVIATTQRLPSATLKGQVKQIVSLGLRGPGSILGTAAYVLCQDKLYAVVSTPAYKHHFLTDCLICKGAQVNWPPVAPQRVAPQPVARVRVAVDRIGTDRNV